MHISIVVVLIVLGVLILGGMLAALRVRRRESGRFSAHLSQVDSALAEAFAQDRGWHRSTLEAAARRAWEERRPGEPVTGLELVEVIDLPGKDQDRAVFRLAGERGGGLLTLGRREDTWVGEKLVED
jgi:hypothetical protein